MMLKQLREKLRRMLFIIARFYESLHIQLFNKIIVKIINVKYGNKNKFKKMIFGIGLSRTGTSSLNSALNELGIKSKHFLYFPVSTSIPYPYFSLNVYSGALDTPIAANFKKLDKMYPNSKFILTIRDIDSWLESCKKFFTQIYYPKKFKKWLDDVKLKI